MRASVSVNGAPEREINLGDNSMPAAQVVKDFIRRVEALEEDKAAIVSDITLVYAEAKATGLNVPIIRAAVRLRKQDREKRESKEALLEMYFLAIGGIDAEL